MYRFDCNCRKLASEFMVITLLFFVLFTYLIVRLTRRSTPTLSTSGAVIAFTAKVLLACAYGYIFQRYYQGDDTWEIHTGGINEWHLLTSNPGEFFLDLLPVKAWKISDGNFRAAWHYYFDKLEWHLQVKPLAISNLLSRGNYYANAVFFSFLTFWGHFLLFKLAARNYPTKQRMLALIIFGYPPVLFWLSGIRSDGLLFVCFAGMLYYGNQWLEQRRTSSLFYLLAGLAGIYIFRKELLLVLLPGLIAWFGAVKSNRKPVQVFAAVYGMAIIVFFASSLLPGMPNPLQLIVNKQQAFLALQANTRFELSALTPQAGSFLQVLPQAFSNTFLRPFLWEAIGPLQLLSALEVLFFWALLIVMLIRRDPKTLLPATPNWAWMALFFSVLYYFLIGYVVPFPGAIVRYKAIPELLLLVLMISYSKPYNWPVKVHETPRQRITLQ